MAVCACGAWVSAWAGGGLVDPSNLDEIAVDVDPGLSLVREGGARPLTAEDVRTVWSRFRDECHWGDDVDAVVIRRGQAAETFDYRVQAGVIRDRQATILVEDATTEGHFLMQLADAAVLPFQRFPALRFGCAEELARCYRLRHGPFSRTDVSETVRGMGDLRTWDPPPRVFAWHEGLDATDAATAQAAVGACEAFQHTGGASGLGVPTWDALWDYLLAQEDRGPALPVNRQGLRDLRAVMEGGSATQEAAFRDSDEDGLSDFMEAYFGEDPSRWDTRGRGWWDGFHPDDLPVGRVVAVPPSSGGVVCVGRNTSDAALAVQVQLGGDGDTSAMQASLANGAQVTLQAGESLTVSTSFQPSWRLHGAWLATLPDLETCP